MSDVEWDADDFEPNLEPKAVAAAEVVTDKWAGEDEDDQVKDAWDEEDEQEDGDGIKATQVKKKKSTKERLAEKEAKKKKELEEKRRKQEEAKRASEMTPEDKMAEKLRQQKMQEEADLELAKEAFGVDGSSDSIDASSPQTKEDFEKFGVLLKDKIAQYESSTHYYGFLETLLRDISIGMEAEDIKKLGSVLTTLGNEKSKAQKSLTTKAKKKSKQKATINAGKDDNYEDYTVGAYDPMEDFI